MNHNTTDAADTVFDLEEHVHPVFRPILEDIALGYFAASLDRVLATMHQAPTADTDDVDIEYEPSLTCWDCGCEIDAEEAEEFDGGCERCWFRAERDGSSERRGDRDREMEVAA